MKTKFYILTDGIEIYARKAMTTEELQTAKDHADQASGCNVFSAKATYTPMADPNLVEINEWIFDSYGILPSGVDVRVLPLTEAQSEYRERLANGWSTD